MFCWKCGKEVKLGQKFCSQCGAAQEWSDEELASQEETIQEELVQEESIHEEPVQEKLIQEELIQEEPIQEELVQEESIHEEPIQEKLIQEELIQEEPIQEELVQEESIHEEPIQEEVIQEEAVQEEAVQEELIQEEVIQEEPVQEERIQKKLIREERISEKPIQEAQVKEAPVQKTQAPESSYGSSNKNSEDSRGDDMILTIFAVACAVFYGFFAIITLVDAVKFILYLSIGPLFLALVTGLSALLGVWMCAMLALIAFKRNKENTDGLLLLLSGGGILLAVVQLVRRIIKDVLSFAVYGIYVTSNSGSFMWTLIGALATVGGIYIILHFVLGEDPLRGKTKDELIEDVKTTLLSIQGMFNKQGTQSTQKAQGASNVQGAQPVQPTQSPQPMPPVQPVQPIPSQGQNNWNTAGSPYGANQYGPRPGAVRLKTDRNLLIHILLMVVTCGIYGLYFVYSIAHDVNIACEGDGQSTPGLLMFILLNVVTCGIYSWFWYYGLGNRLATNAYRYGMSFPENGSSVLLWMLFGSMLCGIGAFIALNIIIKNTNAICAAYNRANGF